MKENREPMESQANEERKEKADLEDLMALAASMADPVLKD